MILLAWFLFFIFSDVSNTIEHDKWFMFMVGLTCGWFFL
jgi:hypothetical protein